MPQDGKREWKLGELADACGVSPRTVRYYVQRGLLPAPVFKGPDTSYGEGHRIRLLAIKKLQEQFLPLDAIEVELRSRSDDELKELARVGAPSRPAAPTVAAAMPAPVVSHPVSRRGSQYERLELAPGLELHVAADVAPDVRELVAVIRQLARGGARGGTR